MKHAENALARLEGYAIGRYLRALDELENARHALAILRAAPRGRGQLPLTESFEYLEAKMDYAERLGARSETYLACLEIRLRINDLVRLEDEDRYKRESARRIWATKGRTQ